MKSDLNAELVSDPAMFAPTCLHKALATVYAAAFAMAATTWHSDLQDALDARVKDDVVVARGTDGAREFAAVQVSAISNVVGDPNFVGDLYEVVTDGSCYMHFVVDAAALTEAAWRELGGAIVAALPDVPTVKDMAPVASATGDGRVRIVFRDVMLGDIADNKRIANAVLACMDERADDYPNARGCLVMDVYERGYSTPLRGVVSRP